MNIKATCICNRKWILQCGAAGFEREQENLSCRGAASATHKQQPGLPGWFSFLLFVQLEIHFALCITNTLRVTLQLCSETGLLKDT